MDGEAHGQGEMSAGDLLEDGQVGEPGLPAAPVLFGVGDPAQPHLAEPAEGLSRELPSLLVGRGGGSHPVGHELPNQRDDLPLLLGEPDVTVQRYLLSPRRDYPRHPPLC
jgi:hypothetical protein